MPGQTLDVKKMAQEFCRDEYRDYLIYSLLARHEKDEARRAILEKLASDEYRHYQFWSKLAGGCSVELSRLEARLILLMRRLFGLVFTLKLLERGEESTVEAYKKMLDVLPEEYREELRQIIKDEEEHEVKIIEGIEEKIVKYMAFVALGLADAIVEVTGVHAGFLGYSATTIIAGVAGLVVGFSASISMASAAYIQAKEVEGRNPLTSALATGLGYIVAVVLMALPYFLTDSMKLAFTSSLLIGLAIVAMFTFYSSVVGGPERTFLREYLETAGVMMGTAFGSYLFGEALRSIFGVPIT
ncbi:VIT1/CCC1 transporter family protein [Stetteria hydrogenophila]